MLGEGMISALIHAPQPDPALAVTMGRLVDSVIEGLVRDAALLDPSCDDLARRVAEEAGCALFRPKAGVDPLAEALDSLRCDWVALIPAGLAPEPVWIRRVQEFLALAASGGEVKGGALFPARPLRAPSLRTRAMLQLGLEKPRAVVLAQRATLRALPAGPDLSRAATKAVHGAGRAVVIRDAVTDLSA